MSKELLSRDRARLARHWLALAVGALASSGVLAFGVVAARVPAVARHLTDTDLALRVLVVHVDLGVVAWFSALPVALFQLHLLAVADAPRAGRAAALAPWLASAGAALFLCGLLPGFGTVHPVNYVPLVAHPLYFVALALFFAGVALSYLDRGLLGRGAPAPAAAAAGAGPALAAGAPLPAPVAATLAGVAPLVRLGAVYVLLALVALGAALVALPRELEAGTRFEALMWGTGHVLQFANLAFATVAWSLLAAWGTGRPLARRRTLAGVVLALALPLAPVLWLLTRLPLDWSYRSGFTLLMQWGLFPAALLFLALVLAPHLAARGSGTPAPSRAALWPLAASVGLMLVGFLYGALIRGSDLRIPGHYHAAIGAVTLAYMALALLVPGVEARAADPAAARAARERVVRAVALLYGTGQLVFATGLVLAGSYGLGRKTYGVEQQVGNAGQSWGLAVMALGGALALAGGATWALAALRRLRALARG